MDLQCHISGKRHLICLSSSLGARDIAFYDFEDGPWDSFELRGVPELALTFERDIGASFSL